MGVIGGSIPFRRLTVYYRSRPKGGPTPMTNKNKAQRAKKEKKKVYIAQHWQLINPNAAGVDVGSREHWAAIPPDREGVKVRRFGASTPDLEAMAEWLKSAGITSVAMEATGVYWIAVFQVLERHGFK